MKPIVIITLIALSSAGIGLFQQCRLAALKRKSAVLAREAAPGSSPEKPVNRPRLRVVNSHPVPQISPHDPVEDIAVELVAMIQKADARFTRVKSGQPITEAEEAGARESQDRLFQTFAALTPVEVLALIHQLESNLNLPEALRKSPAGTCVEILTEANPKVLLDVIPSLKDYPEPNKATHEALDSWLRTSPVAAVKWFDDETLKGNPVTHSAGLLYSVILEETRQDPPHALSRALSQEAEDDPQSIVNLGANTAMRLGEVDENLAFFSALRQQQEKSPDSAVLAKIRSDYVGSLSSRVSGWPFESAVALLDTDCTPAEKAAVAKGFYRGDLDEPDKWATWIMGVAPPASGEPPLKDFMSGWSHVDPIAAGKWLEQAPPGELKDELMKQHANAVSGH